MEERTCTIETRNYKTKSNLLRARHSFVETYSLTSESVNFVRRPLNRLSGKSFIEKALANPYVHTARKIPANRCQIATPWAWAKMWLAIGHYKYKKEAEKMVAP